MSVDGTSFKHARLASKNKDEIKKDEIKRGEYGYGSQEWLAEQAKVSPRTVNELETGRATLKTIDAVSKVLAIKGRKYIKGYGEDFTTFRTTGVVDFRPGINGRQPGNETAYLNRPFLVTLDPVVIKVNDSFIDTATLLNMTLRLSVGDIEIDLSWLYNVSLTSCSGTWLGDEQDVSEIAISTNQPYQTSVMFNQDSLNSVSWKQFIDYIKITNDGRILLTLTLSFEHFKKQGHIIVSVEEMKALFKLSSNFPQNCPYWIQPKAIMV